MKAIVALVISFLSIANAATIAIIDSGVDTEHEMIIPNLWINQTSQIDTLYPGTIYGWNFVENNGQVFDSSLLSTFSPDLKKFYDLRAKAFLFSMSNEEREWMKTKSQNESFIKEVNRFGNYVHGTHVAGIAIRSSKNKAMGIKLLKTEVKSFLENTKMHKGLIGVDDSGMVNQLLNRVAQRQIDGMVKIGKFIDQHKVDVANGSFGTGYDQAVALVGIVYLQILGRAGTEREIKSSALYLLNALVKAGSSFVASAPDTLFVFAAGNDSQNNDEIGFSPSNIKSDNSISVAATYENQFLAPFSNWGVEMVEVAAPGMMIESAIPGNEYLKVSGTSQAAPFVANVAGQVKDANPNLRALEMKKIIMETVDKKIFLTIRVKTGGVVNAKRAILAARLSKKMSVTEAIKKANLDIPAGKSLKSFVPFSFEEMTLPMPSMFEL